MEETPPVHRLTNMFLINMIKRRVPAMRVCADASFIDEWDGKAFAVSEYATPPGKMLGLFIDRLKEMASIPSDAPLHYNATIRLVLGEDRLHDFDVAYARSDGGGVVVVTTIPVVAVAASSNPDLTQRAWIALNHVHEEATREDVRAGVRDAVALVPDEPARFAILRRAASRCLATGLYEDALAYLRLAMPAARDPRERVAVEALLADAQADTNQTNDALETLSRAIAIADELVAPNIQSAHLQQRLAELHVDRNQLDAAERSLARAEALLEHVMGDSAASVTLRRTRVRIVRENGDAAAAETLAIDALGDAEHFELADEAASLHEELADLAHARGDAKTAVDHLRAILQYPSRHALRARVYNALARALHELGSDSEALTALRAATVLADTLPPTHPIRLETDRKLALLTAASPYR